jgi:hypothetical protein
VYCRDWRKRKGPGKIRNITHTTLWGAAGSSDIYLSITDLDGNRLILVLTRAETEQLGKDLTDLATATKGGK